jgi:hypothetical protein
VRNPRRTLAATAGVVLGVGLFSAVLFFIDGSGATLTARAVAPLALDMQRVLTSPLGSGLRLREQLDPGGSIRAGEQVTITLRVTNGGAEPAHDVVVQDERPSTARGCPTRAKAARSRRVSPGLAATSGRSHRERQSRSRTTPASRVRCERRACGCEAASRVARASCRLPRTALGA